MKERLFDRSMHRHFFVEEQNPRCDRWAQSRCSTEPNFHILGPSRPRLGRGLPRIKNKIREMGKERGRERGHLIQRR